MICYKCLLPRIPSISYDTTEGGPVNPHYCSTVYTEFYATKGCTGQIIIRTTGLLCLALYCTQWSLIQVIAG